MVWDQQVSDQSVIRISRRVSYCVVVPIIRKSNAAIMRILIYMYMYVPEVEQCGYTVICMYNMHVCIHCNVDLRCFTVFRLYLALTMDK